MAAQEIYYDPYDYDIDADPHPVWRRMRDEAPVYYNARYDFYALSRFQDVLDAHLDPLTFSSARTTVLEMMDSGWPGNEPPMIFMDPPEHTRFRKLVSRSFTPRRISSLEARIRELAAGFLDPYVGSGGFDYVADFGALLPVMVITALLGAPREDEDQLREWADATLHREPGETGPSEAARAAMSEVNAYWQRHIDARRAEPRDDIMSELIAAELEVGDGTVRHLTDDELHAFYGLLSAAGNETVARFLGWAVTALATFPDQRRRLVDDPSISANAVEEILRYEAPSPIQGRWVTRDVELHGQVIPAGSKVALLTGSANRDDREFHDPDRLDLTRPIGRHVAFGYGVHFCLGAALARLEARVALEETVKRFPTWEVDWDGTEMVHTSTVRGYAKVPIRF
jgi:cytochrome P450